MIEPEVAFADINDNMTLAQDMLVYVVKYILENCEDDLKFLSGRLLDEEKSKPEAERSPLELIEKLKFVTENDFVPLNLHRSY